MISENNFERTSSLKNILNDSDLSIFVYKVKSKFKATTAELKKLTDKVNLQDFDAIISIGGGNIIDFSKILSVYIDPHINKKILLVQQLKKMNLSYFI
ncbi:iron-containing alcohol dehydrogenase [Vibrio sp. PP-XX7]